MHIVHSAYIDLEKNKLLKHIFVYKLKSKSPRFSLILIFVCWKSNSFQCSTLIVVFFFYGIYYYSRIFTTITKSLYFSQYLVLFFCLFLYSRFLRSSTISRSSCNPFPLETLCWNFFSLHLP